MPPAARTVAGFPEKVQKKLRRVPELGMPLTGERLGTVWCQQRSGNCGDRRPVRVAIAAGQTFFRGEICARLPHRPSLPGHKIQCSR